MTMQPNYLSGCTVNCQLKFCLEPRQLRMSMHQTKKIQGARHERNELHSLLSDACMIIECTGCTSTPVAYWNILLNWP